MIKRRISIGKFVVFLVLLNIILIVIPKTSNASSQPVLITLNEAEKSANVGPDDNGTVNFSGMVYVDVIGPGQNIQSIEVTLSADAEDWPATVIPTVMVFESNEHDKPFNVTVQVPLGTDFNDSGMVEIKGKYRYKPGIHEFDISSKKGIITIAPYCIMNISCPNPEKGGNPGDTVRYDLIIMNDGNGDDRFAIGVENLSGLPKGSGILSISRNEVLVERGGEAKVQVIITIDDRANPGIYPISLSAMSLTQMEKANVSVKETCFITLEIEVNDAIGLGKKFFLYSGGITILLCLVLSVILLKKRKK